MGRTSEENTEWEVHFVDSVESTVGFANIFGFDFAVVH